jgi:hypothetical protein
MRRVLPAALVILLLPLLVPGRVIPFSIGATGAQRPMIPPKSAAKNNHSKNEFTFTRLAYPSFGRRQNWTVDWPKADEQFIVGLRGWARSRLDISDDPATVAIDDEALFSYPFLYIVEPGYMNVDEEEALRLREYLARGGFLMLDDFWGEREWSNVLEQLKRILPDGKVQDLPLTHPVFHCYFDIDQVTQVPNYHNWIRNGQTSERYDAPVAYYQAIFDEHDRIVVFIARNQDNGDAWEWIEQPDYPLKYGLAAYRLGMNLIIYSMTH